MALGVDSASNRNEYFLWGEGDRCVRLTTLPLSCTVVMKSGNLNFLEPSGHLQTSNGTALPLYMVVFLFNTEIYVFLFLYLCILIVCLCIFIVPADTLRLS